MVCVHLIQIDDELAADVYDQNALPSIIGKESAYQRLTSVPLTNDTTHFQSPTKLGAKWHSQTLPELAPELAALPSAAK
jgi:hypothetical protein